LTAKSPVQAPILNAPGALAPEERLAAIDTLRGIALLGVLMINLIKEFRVSLFAQFTGVDAGSGSDRLLNSIVSDVFEMKAFALFSLLFGIGLAIQYERLARRGRPGYWLLRRLLVLLGFGLIHLLLIWNGDILTEYAVAGLLVLPLLHVGNRTLLLLALGLLAFYVVMPVLHLPIYWPDETTLRALVESANSTYAHGSFAQIVRFSIGELRIVIPLHEYVFPRTLGLFLLGVYLWRTGVPQDLRRYRRSLAIFGVLTVAIGLALTLAIAADVFSGIAPLGDCLSILAPILQALGYAALIGWALVIPSLAGFFKLFAPLGRMAFTNYILQSLIFGWIFFGYGLGQFGQMRVSSAFLLGIAVYIAQMIGSTLWLRQFRFGPLEWLWRSLMYGQSQPMLRSD
jgi:uncharacterized protein